MPNQTRFNLLTLVYDNSFHHFKNNIWADTYCPTSVYFQVMSQSSMTEAATRVFCKKGVLRNCPKFTRKHLWQSLFFNKVASLRPANLLKKRLWRNYFPVNFVKFLRKPFFIEHLWWLHLSMSINTKLIGRKSCPISPRKTTVKCAA